MSETPMEVAGSQQGTSGRFWCHTCAAEIARREDFTCPNCNGDFIEEIEEGTAADNPAQFVAFDSGTATPAQRPQQQQGQTQQQQTPQQQFPPFAFPFAMPPQQGQPISLDLNQLFQQVNTFMQQLSVQPPQHVNIQHQPFLSIPIFQAQMPTGAAPGATQGTTPQQPPMPPFMNMFQQIFSGLGGMEPMVGNPGDYAWGNIDNIISHLFENAGDRGPPPAAKEEVERLAKVQVTAENVAAEEECPICKDSYKLDEEVLQLGCEHRFHPQCIKEWLARRNTCPVCRFELKPEVKQPHNHGHGPGGNNGGGAAGGRGGAGRRTTSSRPMHFYA